MRGDERTKKRRKRKKSAFLTSVVDYGGLSFIKGEGWLAVK